MSGGVGTRSQALIAALPMYDWPERRTEVDAEWAILRDRLRALGIAAPEQLTRRNADMPAVPGGIRDGGGRLVAEDPAKMPPDELDTAVLWRHPKLLLAQTCHGPLETTGLAALVRIVGQPDYSGFEGGEGGSYRSAIVMRSGEGGTAPAFALPPAWLLRGRRLAFNDEHSMSGLLALERDLEAAGEDAASLIPARLRTGSHRASVRAVASGEADVAAIDCRSWYYCLRHEAAARELAVVGWTRLRPGLPYIASRQAPAYAF